MPATEESADNKEEKVHSLSANQVESFRLNGFLTVEDVLTDDELEILAKRTDLIASGKAEHIPERCIQQESVFRRGEREVDDPGAVGAQAAHAGGARRGDVAARHQHEDRRYHR